MSSSTPIPMLSPDELLAAAKKNGATLEDLRSIGQECFRPYAEAIKNGTHEKNYVIRLPGLQGYTDVFSRLNEDDLIPGVNSLDGKYHILQHCHYTACYQTERMTMPQEQSMATPQQIRELFAPATKTGEKLKIRSGPAGTVVYNDSNVGKPQDRLTSETFSQLETAISQDMGSRVDVPLGKNQKPKRPEIEVIAIDEEGTTRTLFRQEKGLGISTNALAGLTKQRTEQNTDQVNSEHLVVDAQPTAAEPLPVDSQLTEDSESQPIVAQPATVEPVTNTIETLQSNVDSLPPSQTKALWQKISADFSTLNTQLQAISQTGKDLKDGVTEVPKAIYKDTEDLIQQGKQKLENIRSKIESSVKQTSLNDLASMAIKGTSLAVEKGSQGLGIASQYLSDRADKVKSYGMAKAAIAIYQKGNSRTGESIFKAEGYTVEAVTEGYKVKDQKDRLIMSFATDAKGKPISVTKHPAIQPADYKAINHASRNSVIHGSQEGEQAYESRLQSIATSIRELLPEGTEINGSKYFHIKRPTYQGLTIETHGFPQRQLNIDEGGNITNSTLTIEDMNRLGNGLEQSQSQNIDSTQKETEKVPVGIEMG